jgi:hypothetical protein
MFWVYLGLGLVAALDLLNAARRLAQFKKWAERSLFPALAAVALGAGRVGRPDCGVGGVPALLGTVLAGPTSWGEMFAQLPDATAWLWVSIALNLAMGVRQVLPLVKRPVSS